MAIVRVDEQQTKPGRCLRNPRRLLAPKMQREAHHRCRSRPWHAATPFRGPTGLADTYIVGREKGIKTKKKMRQAREHSRCDFASPWRQGGNLGEKLEGRQGHD